MKNPLICMVANEGNAVEIEQTMSITHWLSKVAIATKRKIYIIGCWLCKLSICMVLAAFSFAESTMWEYIWVVLTLVCPSIDLIV